jgi:riboflavin kinase/FMN adenylyltransferase
MSKTRSVVTLGTFDGVHRGHQQILNKVVQRARALGARSVALSFGMPPRLGHNPAAHPVLLSTLSDKLQILKRLGIQDAQILIFDRKTASTPPEIFFRRRVLRRCRAREMVVGPRVAFGKNRAGRLPMLKRLGRASGVRIHAVGRIKVGGVVVSSSAIRERLYRGDVEAARQLLGYPYSLAGKVIHGDHRGRKLGYPTANLSVEVHKILPPGVFWIKCLPDAHRIPLNQRDIDAGVDGLCNVGTRPTFTPEATQLHCEVFLFKKPRALYGKSLRVVFMRRIRAEKRFRSPAELVRQIARDFKKAKRWADSSALHWKLDSI